MDSSTISVKASDAITPPLPQHTHLSRISIPPSHSPCSLHTPTSESASSITPNNRFDPATAQQRFMYKEKPLFFEDADISLRRVCSETNFRKLQEKSGYGSGGMSKNNLIPRCQCSIDPINHPVSFSSSSTSFLSPIPLCQGCYALCVPSIHLFCF